jgi:ERCC4-type nuclease
MDKDTSRILLQHFGSIAAFLSSTEKQLMKIKDLSNEQRKAIFESISIQ